MNIGKEQTHVHANTEFARRFSPDGTFEWHEPKPPHARGEDDVLRTADPFWTCSYCGSMHPSELARAIEAGAKIEWADQKYGWPHKVYVRDAPNRYKGQMEIRSAEYPAGGAPPIAGPETPAGLAEGKFYTVHLQDATGEERSAIESAIGLTFTFEGTTVAWKPVAEPTP